MKDFFATAEKNNEEILLKNTSLFLGGLHFRNDFGYCVLSGLDDILQPLYIYIC